MQRNLTCVLFLSVLGLTAPTLAQSPAASRYAWTGVTIGPDGARGTQAAPVDEDSAGRRSNPRATADRLLAQIADVELSIDIDRDLARAAEQLDELWVRASWNTAYHARFEVLQRIALVRSRLAERRGARDEALAALGQLLPGEPVRQALGSRFELEPAPAELLEGELAALAAPSLTQAAARLGGAGQVGKTPVPVDKGIEETVREAILNGWPQNVIQIGSRAAPALETIALEEPGKFFANPNIDPLTLLLDVAELRGAQMLRTHLNAGGLLWHKRIFAAMDQLNVLRLPSTWGGVGEGKPPALLKPVWAELLDDMCGLPDVRRECLQELVIFAGNDALTPKMQATITAALNDEDADVVSAALAVLNGNLGPATLRPVAEQALRAGSPAVKQAAAYWLSNEKRSEALLAAAGDPNPDVRRSVARSFTVRPINLRVTASTTRTENFKPEIGPRERAVLEKLVADEDEAVRSYCAGVAAELEPPLAPEVYTRLAQDADWEVRRIMCVYVRESNPALPAVLDFVSREASARAYEVYERRLRSLCINRGGEDASWFLPYLPAFLRRLEHCDIASDVNTNGDYLDGIFSHALRAEGGMNGVTERVLAAQPVWPMMAWLRQLPVPQGSTDQRSFAAFAKLDPQLLERAARRVYAIDSTYMRSLADRLQMLAARGICQLPAWKAILADGHAERWLRAQAAQIASPAADDEYERALIAFLSDPSWSGRAWDLPERGELRSTGKGYALARIESFALALIRDPRVRDQPTGHVLGGLAAGGLPESCAKPLLERWIGAGDSFGFDLNSALEKLPAADDAATVELLRKALATPELSLSAVAAMGRMKQPAYLDILSAVFDPSWQSSDPAFKRKLDKAVASALTSYMSQDAAERLLRGVTLVSSEEARTQCLAGLDQIRQYLDEKKRWEARASDGEKRDLAVRETLKLCDDPDPATRAQAAKGLATLDAAEHLPKLIAMLKDKSPEVRTAAQQALDALHARAQRSPPPK